MRTSKWTWLSIIVGGFSLCLLMSQDLRAQWGVIQKGVDAARQGSQGSSPSQAAPAPSQQDPNAPFNRGKMGEASAAPMTYQNRRHFSYTIPAGWQKEQGDPTGESASFGRPGSTESFTIHMTQMVPSFPRKAAVDAGYKQAKEEMSIGKYMAVKRRDQGGKDGVIGWEAIETAAKRSGGF
jgi:hypothetical protein